MGRKLTWASFFTYGSRTFECCPGSINGAGLSGRFVAQTKTLDQCDLADEQNHPGDINPVNPKTAYI